MKPDLPNDDRKQSSQLGIPFARCPKGHWIYSQGQLPEMPIPSYVHVAREYVECDGWIFPIRGMKKGTLVWFNESLTRWGKEDCSEENKSWVKGIAEAIGRSAEKCFGVL